MSIPRITGCSSALLLSALLTGCAGVAPTSLRTPEQVSCINVNEPLAFNDKYGLLDIVWEVQMTPGVYVSEKEDDQGTYYRAPPGGVYIARPEFKDKPASIGTHMRYDGGIFIPKLATGQPRLYNYVSMESVAEQPQPKGISCGEVTYVKDPVTGKLSLGGMAAAGGAAGLTARAALQNAGVSYGQAAAGGAVGMLVVGAILNAEQGRIAPTIELKDQAFIGKLRQLGSQAVPLKAGTPTPL